MVVLNSTLKMDSHAWLAHHTMLPHKTTNNVSQPCAEKTTQLSEMPTAATDVDNAQMDGNQMPCRENVLELDQLATADRSIQPMDTNVSNAHCGKLPMLETPNASQLLVPTPNRFLVHHKLVMHAKDAQLELTQIH